MAVSLPPGAPSAEDLFFDTVQDLGQRSHLRATPYEVAQSAGLVRRLIMDEKPLYEPVVRELSNVKIKFEVGNLHTTVSQLSGNRMLWCTGPWLDAQLYLANTAQFPGDPLPPWTLTLKEFLAHTVAQTGQLDGSPGVPKIEPQSASVKELVRFYANLLGGVHVGMEKNPNSVLVEMIEYNEAFLRETMSAVSRTVLRSLEPIANLAVIAKRPTPFGLRNPWEEDRLHWEDPFPGHVREALDDAQLPPWLRSNAGPPWIEPEPGALATVRAQFQR